MKPYSRPQGHLDCLFISPGADTATLKGITIYQKFADLKS